MTRILSAFASDRRGSISITGGLLLVALFGSIGAAVDFSNAHKRRVDFQDAADAAALAGAARPEMTTNEIKELAEANLRRGAAVGNANVMVTRDSGGKVSVEIDAQSRNFMLTIVGMSSIDVSAESKAVFVPAANGKIEVALVLDTTQSMADDMAKLRSSAEELANTLFDVGGENVKISIVPYVASVNIGNDAAQMAWMDTVGTAQYNGYRMRDRDITRCTPVPPSGTNTDDDDDDDDGGSSTPACYTACGCPGTPSCGGGTDGARLKKSGATKFAGGLLEGLFGTTALNAAPLPYPTPNPNSCPIKNPAAINHFDLFEAIPDTSWMGCVEARPAPYDVTDVSPDAADANTKFVPYFWPDEADWYGDDSNIDWENDYVDDDQAGPIYNTTTSEFPTWSGRRRANVYKYNDIASSDVTISEGSPDIVGPNRACPDPMMPLNDDRAAVLNKIGSLTHRNGGGTIISEGLMWGWRALSPGAPFSEGAAYGDETRKIVIVMSDGANTVIARNKSDGTPADETLGDYTAYGFAYEYDQNAPTRNLIDTSADTSTPYFDQVRNFLNERTETACRNIKSAGTEDNPVEIYTVLVGDADSATEEVMASCATTRQDHYKEVSEMSVLQEAFEEVAQEIAGKGSSRIVN